MKGEKDVVEQDQSPESAVLQCTQGAAGHTVGGGEELWMGLSRIKVYRQLCCRVCCALLNIGRGEEEEERRGEWKNM